jgi:signal transduction protein with GAF and PtsI domain
MRYAQAMELLESVDTKDLDKALHAVLEHFKCQVGTIHVIESDGKLHLRAHTKGLPPDIVEASRVIPIGKGIAGLAAQNKKPMNMCNLYTDSDPKIPIKAKQSGMMGAICVPMMKGDDVIGTLGVAVMHERTFTKDEEDLLQRAGQIIAKQL